MQQAIDAQAAAGTLGDPAAPDFIRWLHRAFYEGAGKPMLTIGEGARAFRLEPGTWRSDPAHDVSVGRHVPPSSAHVGAFMAYFYRRFAFDPAPDARLLGEGLLPSDTEKGPVSLRFPAHTLETLFPRPYPEMG